MTDVRVESCPLVNYTLCKYITVVVVVVGVFFCFFFFDGLLVLFRLAASLYMLHLIHILLFSSALIYLLCFTTPFSSLHLTLIPSQPSRTRTLVRHPKTTHVFVCIRTPHCHTPLVQSIHYLYCTIDTKHAFSNLSRIHVYILRLSILEAQDENPNIRYSTSQA